MHIYYVLYLKLTVSKYCTGQLVSDPILYVGIKK